MTRPAARRAPVVSIGNLAMGGRGKTPVVAQVARLLLDAGERPAILSRGYARRDPTDEVVVVSDGRHQLADLERSGDEPVLLARVVPGAAVLVSPVRARAAALAEATLGVTVHVLDDGFQHRSLERDIDIVLIRLEDLDDRRAPFGRLRSSVRSLARAHAVIVDDASADQAASALGGIIDPKRTAVFTMTRSLGDAWWLEEVRGQRLEVRSQRLEVRGQRLEVRSQRLEVRSQDLRDVSVVAMAAIADPARFTGALRAAGWTVSTLVSFRDHHAFTRRDLDRVRTAMVETGAAAVATTEKDAMRLLPLRPLGVPVAVVPLQVTIGPAGQFAPWLGRELERARA